MLLRASSEKTGENSNLQAVTDSNVDVGLPHSAHLKALTEAALTSRWADLRDAYAAAACDMDEQQVVDTLVVASAFNGITRVADATGIPLDEQTQLSTVDIRATTGIDRYDYQEKSARYDASS